MKKIVIKEKQKRIDKYLSEELNISRSTISKMINEEYILLNDNKTKSSISLKEDDIISIKDGFIKEMDIIPQDIKLDIVYEDEDIIVVNKKSGMVVHPGSGNYSDTLVNALMFHTNKLSDINGEIRPGIIHRLDKDTSGLMLVAKTNKAHEILADDFKYKRVKREYIALLDGVFPHQSATIDAPIGRDIIERKKMMVTANNSKKAISNLKVIKRFENNTLVSFVLDTGRTHQIRVHASYIGYPVHNDPIYGKGKNDNFNQFLHSKSITFIHPITKKEMHFDCELPKTMTDYIDTLKEL